MEENKYKMVFGLTKDQVTKYHLWGRYHQCKLKDNSVFPGDRYAGAIGGADTFAFIPTGLGVIAKVKCLCGAELDLTIVKHTVSGVNTIVSIGDEMD